VEHLRGTEGSLHPVQQAMVDFHGSQCGFCTPGFVMSLYALWMQDLDPTEEAIETALQGNLCRCTGYEPIIRAAKVAAQVGGQDQDALIAERTRTISRLEALADGSWAPLSGLVAKIRREERYHAMHIGAWLVRLASVDGEPRDRLVAALRVLDPDAATVFTPLAGASTLVDAGILAAPMADLEASWRAMIEPVLGGLGLPLPSEGPGPGDGRTRRGDDFAWLHGQFTSVRHSDPGATW